MRKARVNRIAVDIWMKLRQLRDEHERSIDLIRQHTEEWRRSRYGRIEYCNVERLRQLVDDLIPTVEALLTFASEPDREDEIPEPMPPENITEVCDRLRIPPPGKL